MTGKKVWPEKTCFNYSQSFTHLDTWWFRPNLEYKVVGLGIFRKRTCWIYGWGFYGLNGLSVALRKVSKYWQEVEVFIALKTAQTVQKAKEAYLYSTYYELLISRHLAKAHVNEGSHSFTCHRQVYPQVEWTILAFTPHLQRIATLWLVLISCSAEGKEAELAWVAW